MIKFKAKLGHWSSIVGMPIMLLDEQGEVVGQLGLMNYKSGTTWPSKEAYKEAYIEFCQQIVDQLNGASQS
jgi:hypothetical protein